MLKYMKTICPYCGCGCSINLHIDNGRLVKTSPVIKDSVNEGVLCIKGALAHEFVQSPKRLNNPLIKYKGEFVETTWNEALDFVADNFLRIKQESGGDAFGVFSSARATNEENYLTSKFARAVLGTNNIDHCARL